MFYVRETDVMAAATDEFGYVRIIGSSVFGAIPYKTLEEAVVGLSQVVDSRTSDWLQQDLYYKEEEEKSKNTQRSFFYKDDFGILNHVTFDILKAEKID